MLESIDQIPFPTRNIPICPEFRPRKNLLGKSMNKAPIISTIDNRTKITRIKNNFGV